MSSLDFILTVLVSWFWFHPERAGVWLARAKRGFKIETVHLERGRLT